MAKSAKSLDSLLSLERLRTLTGHDESLLYAMLAMTLKSNSTDLNVAAALYARADWGELAKACTVLPEPRRSPALVALNMPVAS